MDKRKIREIIRRKLWGESSSIIAKSLNIPVQKIGYIWKTYWGKLGLYKNVLVFDYGKSNMEVYIFERKIEGFVKVFVKNKLFKVKDNKKQKKHLDLLYSRIERKRQTEREYRRNNTNFRVANNLRCRLRMALKSQGTSKTNKTMVYLGCTKEYLREHLQNKFKESMNWDNYGKWHIDHIKPLSRFDLTKEEEIHKAMHHTNLQPLWASENLRKNAYFVE